jgi:hypothetical protein
LHLTSVYALVFLFLEVSMEMKERNFVAPYPKERTEIVEVMRELPAAPITPPMPYSGHVDRAKGFSIATLPLAGATGVVVLLIGISAFGVPLLSVAALLLALGGFCVVWLLAYLAHVFVSADGALVLHTIMGWRYLKREQSNRFKRYDLKGDRE